MNYGKQEELEKQIAILTAHRNALVLNVKIDNLWRVDMPIGYMIGTVDALAFIVLYLHKDVVTYIGGKVFIHNQDYDAHIGDSLLDMIMNEFP